MSDRLAKFLYVLMRDHVPVGIVEEVMHNHLEKADGRQIVYSNPHLAEYARQLSARITGTRARDCCCPAGSYDPGAVHADGCPAGDKA